VITSYLDDIRVGDTSASRARTITETDIVAFAMVTGDWHSIHTDVEYAAREPRFGQRIAHGALVLSVALGLVEFWPPAMRAFYGVDGLRFVRPTVIGDTLHVDTEVGHIERRDGGCGVVTARFVVRNQRDDEVMVADLKVLVAARPVGDGDLAGPGSRGGARDRDR
jgi:acyl dehydratase